jgi:hypothetical protein
MTAGVTAGGVSAERLACLLGLARLRAPESAR